MAIHTSLLGLLALVCIHAVQCDPEIDRLKVLTKQSEGDIKLMKQTLESLTRQLMLQQLFVEERTRSDGDSGLKQVRVENVGTRNYFSDSFSQKSVGALHDHPEYDRTVGMGEVNMVMNGVDFRTRHNDYKLVMPHRHSRTFGAVENIPLPGVPSSVTSKHTLPEQIQEMREYFKAFRDQDTKHRNYEPYFKPVLCYMEGYWTTDKNIREPFHSDRYTLDASSWEDLQDKIRYTSQTGLKNVNENYAHLPRVIMNVNNGTPEFAQWNYDILCHPIQTHFTRKDLRIIDDLSARLANAKTLEEFSQTNAARFDFTVYPGSYNGTLGYSKERAGERNFLFNTLDKIMQEIPGKDNYIGDTKDNSFGLQVCNILYTKNYTALNTGRYHRTYKVTQNGAMGTRTILRGYADRHLWSAQSTQPNIAELSVTDCPYVQKLHKKVCTTYKAKYTYAIPLEIIWLTPLYNWNPLSLPYHSGASAATVYANGRNGGMDSHHAFNGVSFDHFYKTPAEFFTSNATSTVGVLDSHNTVRKVAASGTRMFTPEIPGVGRLRMRYPVMPTHAEGSGTEKEVDALKDMVMDMQTYGKYFDHDPNPTDPPHDRHDQHYVTSITHLGRVHPHYHDVYLTPEELQQLRHHHTVFTYTGHAKDDSHSPLDGHQHAVEIENVSGIYRIKTCDGQDHCKDGHTNTLTRRIH